MCLWLPVFVSLSYMYLVSMFIVISCKFFSSFFIMSKLLITIQMNILCRSCASFLYGRKKNCFFNESHISLKTLYYVRNNKELDKKTIKFWYLSEDVWIWITFWDRLQTVSRVDQDFDIRRVQTAAEKFIPVYRPRGRPPQQPQKKVSV